MRHATVAIAVLATLLFAAAAPADAGSQMALKQSIISSVQSHNRTWKNCGSVSFTAPSNGYVVVTASGQAGFSSVDYEADLYLTIAKSPGVEGPWVFGITPGSEPVQAYTVRRAFTISKGQTITFYLNGSSMWGSGRAISVETSILSAEFYPRSQTFPQKAAEAPREAVGDAVESSDGKVLSNAH
ncbi:MAG TPA: hypothetical protein PK250_05500 [Syntrophobacter fumaroxidans]|nr:hypothetical protein [Syntrophobacter fumaroxidans]